MISADFGVPRARSVGGLRRRPMHHLSSRVVTSKMVHRTLDETPASSRTRTLKMAGNAPCTIPLRAVSGRFSGSRSPRCEGLIKRAMHHLSSRDAGRKMLHRTLTETPYTSSTRHPEIGRNHPFRRFRPISAQKWFWLKLAPGVSEGQGSTS